MSTLGWMGAVVVGGVAVFFASIVRIVPAEQPAPAPVPAAPVAAQPVATSVTALQQVAVAPVPRVVTLAEHPLLTVPVQGITRNQIHDTWGQSRANGARTHQATDIMAPGGAQVIAAAPGTVEKLYYSNGGGGITLYVRSPDRAWEYYYAHLQGYAPGIHEGQVVVEGELLGFVGDTGNAGTGNFHLHFAMAHMGPADRWWQGEPINPYPLLAGTAPAR